MVLTWFVIGIITSIVYILNAIIKKIDLKIKDLISIFEWIVIGPILWLFIRMIFLTEFIQNHLDDDIMKFK